jgi:membrane-bound lytic murein transglycosylase D
MEDSMFKNMPDPEKELIERSQVSSVSAASSGSSGKSKLYYTVKSGDNLGFISEWYDCTVQQIRNWNGMYGNTIRVGQKLTIYVPKEKYDHYSDLNSMSHKEKQEWKASGGTTHIKKDDSCNCVYYKVRSGDTLWEISQKYRVGIESIKKENKISSNELKVGMVLKITFG